MVEVRIKAVQDEHTCDHCNENHERVINARDIKNAISKCTDENGCRCTFGWWEAKDIKVGDV